MVFSNIILKCIWKQTGIGDITLLDMLGIYQICYFPYYFFRSQIKILVMIFTGALCLKIVIFVFRVANKTKQNI